MQQAPVTINLEAPRRAGIGPKTQNQDATLEALALSRSAQAPNTNWRSSGANERRAAQPQLDTSSIMRLLRGRNQ